MALVPVTIETPSGDFVTVLMRNMETADTLEYVIEAFSDCKVRRPMRFK